MFFINPQHEENFQEFCFVNGKKSTNPEYRTVYYILSVPELYKNVKEKDKAPLGWTREWDITDTNYEMSDAYLALSHSEQLLVELAQNLFNGQGNFNLMEAISVFGADYKQVTMEAVRVREGKL